MRSQPRGATVEGYDRRVAAEELLFKRFRRVMGRNIYQVCRTPSASPTCFSSATVPLCANDWENRELLGNVQHTTLREIYNSPRLLKSRADAPGPL